MESTVKTLICKISSQIVFSVVKEMVKRIFIDVSICYQLKSKIDRTRIGGYYNHGEVE